MQLKRKPIRIHFTLKHQHQARFALPLNNEKPLEQWNIQFFFTNIHTRPNCHSVDDYCVGLFSVGNDNCYEYRFEVNFRRNQEPNYKQETTSAPDKAAASLLHSCACAFLSVFSILKKQ